MSEESKAVTVKALDVLFESLIEEMGHRFDQPRSINISADGFTADPNPQFLHVDDTQSGVEFAFEFLRPHLDALTARIAVLEEALKRIAHDTRNCQHDGGFDREFGPVGCMLGDKCVCIGVHPIATAALGGSNG